MLVLDYKKGVAEKKPYKTRYFCHRLLERKRVKRIETERERERGQKHGLFIGGLKNGQGVVPPFWAQRFHVFKSAKTPTFKVFPGKALFFWTRLC